MSFKNTKWDHCKGLQTIQNVLHSVHLWPNPSEKLYPKVDFCFSSLELLITMYCFPFPVYFYRRIKHHRKENIIEKSYRSLKMNMHSLEHGINNAFWDGFGDICTNYQFASQVSYLLLMAPGKQVHGMADLHCFYILGEEWTIYFPPSNHIWYMLYNKTLCEVFERWGHFHILTLNLGLSDKNTFCKCY